MRSGCNFPSSTGHLVSPSSDVTCPPKCLCRGSKLAKLHIWFAASKGPQTQQRSYANPAAAVPSFSALRLAGVLPHRDASTGLDTPGNAHMDQGTSASTEGFGNTTTDRGVSRNFLEHASLSLYLATMPDDAYMCHDPGLLDAICRGPGCHCCRRPLASSTVQPSPDRTGKRQCAFGALRFACAPRLPM
ncbi:hypothetical protein BC628DRAFT_1014834 [Trametes gibbosa]|nr:hypothetical protein BC628DRAFT_1014834 [Trametes gibbosa]